MRRGCGRSVSAVARVSVVVGLLGLVGLLAGCQGGAAVSASPPTVVTPTVVTPTAVTPTAVTPTAGASPGSGSSQAAALAAVPAAARAHTSAGAQAFAEFYLAQLNKAWSVPDPEAIRPYATANCKSCHNFVGAASELARRGERYAGPAVDVVTAAYLPESTSRRARVSVVAYQAAVAVVTRDGVVVRKVRREP